MKNPFKKKSNTLLIAGIAIGAAAASLAYLFLTESGTAVRQQLAGYFDRDVDESDEDEDPQDYLHHTAKAPKTDREALLRHEVLHNNGNAQS
ncbi:hypothetical protein ACFQZS_10310 [Mucilaginibacter calamicampi]|uniref:YtxH-like protein n=1 Tax=Mucilaginibacter calamicampi TaxID=1302352 RepID=A0ABW2YYP7_9SPHI